MPRKLLNLILLTALLLTQWCRQSQCFACSAGDRPHVHVGVLPGPNPPCCCHSHRESEDLGEEDPESEAPPVHPGSSDPEETVFLPESLSQGWMLEKMEGTGFSLELVENSSELYGANPRPIQGLAPVSPRLRGGGLPSSRTLPLLL